jgi:Right handed beta helix region
MTAQHPEESMIRPPCIALVLSLAPALIVTSGSLTAQLSGAFTIDPNGSGSRNYKSFGAAVFDLWKKRMNGPVTITVAPGTYSENWGVVPISGMSTTNTLTFKSKVKHGVVLKPSTGTAITMDYSKSYSIRGVTLDGFRFPKTTRTAIHAKTASANIEIKNCLFEGTLGIVAAEPRQWNIHHCQFLGALQPVSISGYDDCEFHHNDVRINGGSGFTATKARVPLTGRLRIYNNLFTGKTDTNRAALRLIDGGFGAEVTHNTFRVTAADDEGMVRVVGVLAMPTRLFGNIFVGLSRSTILTVETTSPFELQLDGNLYQPAGPFLARPRLGSSNWTLSDWRRISGQDKNSVQADPKFKGGTPYDLRLRVPSPAAGKALGSPSYVRDDFDGKRRIQPSAIGAFEGPVSTFVLFGAGCPGSGLRVPKFGTSGAVRMGSTNFTLILSNALGGSGVTAFLVVGATKQTIPFGGTCNLLVSPHLVLPNVMRGSSGPGNGVVLYKLNIPRGPRLFGKQAHFQWAVTDPLAGPRGLAFSPAGTLTLLH